MSRRDLSDVLASWRTDAAVLQRAGHAHDAALLLRLADEVTDAAEEWLLWLSETDASIRCGRSRVWLRGRFADWQRDGHAVMKGRERFYRACVIPRRSAVAAATQAGAAAARALRDAA